MTIKVLRVTHSFRNVCLESDGCVSLVFFLIRQTEGEYFEDVLEDLSDGGFVTHQHLPHRNQLPVEIIKAQNMAAAAAGV